MLTCALAPTMLCAEPDGQALRIVAKVDKTTVELGGQVILIITLEGDVTNVNLQPFEFPKALQVVAKSQASNLSLGLGEMKRSVSLTYILVPQEAGTFRLGPFQVIHRGKPLLTDPLEIVVKKPLVPPGLEERQRYTL